MNPVGRRRRVRLAAEVILLFYGLPLLYVILRWPSFVFALLWPSAAIAAWVLLRDPTFDRRKLFRIDRMRGEWPDVIVLLGVAVVAIVLLVLTIPGGQFFGLPSQRPGLWVLIVLLYPILSVYPQELIWRGLFFHRYALLFGNGKRMLIASSLAFAWVHVIMLNALAVWLCVPAGIIFSRRYQRSASLMAVWAEHSLYGIAVFTIGLGAFFFHGTFQKP